MHRYPGSRDWFLIRHIGSFVMFKMVHLKRKLTKVHRGSRHQAKLLYSTLWDQPELPPERQVKLWGSSSSPGVGLGKGTQAKHALCPEFQNWTT